jgi:hypothetical protein
MSWRRIPALPSALLALAAATSCIGDADLPPAAPTLYPVVSPTTIPHQEIGGTKEAGTAVLNHGDEIVPADGSESWRADLPLVVGDNPLSLRARSRRGKQSRATTATIRYEPPCPPSPTLSALVSPTSSATQTLSGTKPPATAVVLTTLDANGSPVGSIEVQALGDELTWQHALVLTGGDGRRAYALSSRDAAGRQSEPVLFNILLDTARPAAVDRYPASGATGVPLDAAIEVALDEELALDASALPATVLTLHNDTAGVAVAATLTYNALAHSLTLRPATLPAGNDFTATLAAADVADLAGNALAANATWSFATGSGSGAPAPTAPAITSGATTPTTASSAPLVGTKPANSSVWINDLEVAPLGAGVAWSTAWALNVGGNELSVVAKGPNGAASAPLVATIIRTVITPEPPVLSPAPPATSTSASVVLSGTKEADTAVLLFRDVAVCRTTDTSWGFVAPLVPGVNELLLRTRNAALVESDPVVVRVEYAQPYAGPVPPGFSLYVGLQLRDLSRVLPVSGSFDTGANHYSIDAWLEGPLDAGESCAYDSGAFERRSTKLAATLTHYRGTKAGHENPFSDADYRAADYLAALISAGALAGVGLGPGMDRRDGAGHQSTAVSNALTLAAVDAIDATCGGVPALTLDGCTGATRVAGLEELLFEPIDPDGQRLRQGDYLLHVAIGLDRDPGWVGANDFETCWGDAAFTAEGGHRIVQRLSLGSTPYTVRADQIVELSGPDGEPAAVDGRLRYLAEDGVIVSWGPR